MGKWNKIHRSLISILSLVFFLLFLAGCGGIPQVTKTTTTEVDGVKTTVVEENTVPDALSDAVANMIQACYESFEDEDKIPGEYLEKLESSDLKDVLVFKEYRLGLREANGFNPREVCKSPTTIYDYAIAHDKELFHFGRSMVKDLTGTAPWLAIWKTAVAGVDGAGDSHGDGSIKVVGDENRVTTGSIRKTTTTTINDRSQFVEGSEQEQITNDAPEESNTDLF